MIEYDEVVDEIMQSGVRALDDMGDMDVKLMLVKLRTAIEGRLLLGRGRSQHERHPPAVARVQVRGVPLGKA